MRVGLVVEMCLRLFKCLSWYVLFSINFLYLSINAIAITLKLRYVLGWLWTTHKRSHDFGWMVVNRLTTNESYSSGGLVHVFRGSIILFVWGCDVNLYFIVSESLVIIFIWVCSNSWAQNFIDVCDFCIHIWMLNKWNVGIVYPFRGLHTGLVYSC